MLYLTVEDIVANSIIELNQLDGSKEVLIDEAKKYGEEVSKHLRKRGYYTLLKLNPGLTESFEIKYGNYFSKYYQDETYGYRLNDGKEVEDIVPIFRDPLVYEVIESFTSLEVIENSFSDRVNSKYSKLNVMSKVKKK